MYGTTAAIVATVLNSCGLKTQHVKLRDELADLVKQQEEQSRG